MQTIAVFPLLNCSGAYMIFSILGLAVVWVLEGVG